MSKYFVSLEVIYSDTVEADSAEEAVEKVMCNCPYDNEPSCEPYVKKIEEEQEEEQEEPKDNRTGFWEFEAIKRAKEREKEKWEELKKHVEEISKEEEQEEAPLGFDMICTGGPYGDCTCAYRLELKREYTIKEFVEEIVKKKPGEWGTIYHCKDLKEVYGAQLDTCDYSHGEITNHFSLIATGQQKIKEVIAHGGWTAMNYYIKTE